MAYLTDVFILPEYRAHGLGKWLIKCCNELMEGLPLPRRTFLMASIDIGKRFYAKGASNLLPPVPFANNR